MPEYVQVDTDAEPASPPPYMDPANSKAKRKFLEKQLSSLEDPKSPKSPKSPKTPKTPKRCEHCGSYPTVQPQHMMIWPAPRPRDHIRPDNTKFFGYVVLIAIVIFLLFAACKYLP